MLFRSSRRRLCAHRTFSLSDLLFILSVVTAALAYSTCPIANGQGVKSIGPQMEIQWDIHSGDANQFRLQPSGSSVIFHVARNLATGKSDIYTEGNKQNKAFYYGVQYDGPTITWSKNPNNELCSIPFDHNNEPTKYFVREAHY